MEGRAAAWTLFGVVIGFKVVGSLIILLVSPTPEAVSAVVILSWPFILAVVVVLIPPTLYFARLLRGRARRARMIREEWQVDSHSVEQRTSFYDGG